jgi:hypothetical protein
MLKLCVDQVMMGSRKTRIESYVASDTLFGEPDLADSLAQLDSDDSSSGPWLPCPA